MQTDEETQRLPAKESRRSSNRSWLHSLMCCLKSPEDEILELDFCHCNLKDVPAEVFNYERTLEQLRLDCNQIADLPRPLFHCHGLKNLSLSDNEIAELPTAIASLIHLQVLDLSKNSLGEVPDTIKGCKALTVLDLSINPLGKYPEGGTQLLSLEELYLNDTFLEFLPANFGRLTKLRVLELRENQLANLPKSMARLTALQRLDIGYNDLSDLPEVVGSLHSLTELWVDGNKLEVIPDFVGSLKNLTHLDVSRNDLQGIAPTLGLCKSLTDLSLSSNNLEALPEDIGGLQNLVTLRVDDNQLLSLPESIGRLSNLQELQVGQNRLTKLPTSVGLLRKLHTLLADNNQLDEIPSELGSCQQLTVLSLRNNKLEQLPPEVGHLAKMRVMNLSCNKIKYLPVSFLKFPSLAALWLSEAQTKPVVPLQTDTDHSTGHKVLTCFLLPQTEANERREEKESSPRVVPARLATHIKFAPDNELERPGRLMRNPTPYPKELKAMAKHAQLLHSSQTSAAKGSKVKASTPPAEAAVAITEPKVHQGPKEDTPTISAKQKQVAVSPLPEAKLPSIQTVEERTVVHVKEAEVSRPLPAESPREQLELRPPAEEPPAKETNLKKIVDKVEEIARPEQPPPYHVAAAFSRHAAEFENLRHERLTTNEPLTITAETHSPPVPTENIVDGAELTELTREPSPGQDSGRGQSVEPLDDIALEKDDAVDVQPVETSKPPLQKRDTYILIKPVDASPTAAEPTETAAETSASEDLPDSLITTWNFSETPVVTVAASPPASAALPLSAANIVGLPNLKPSYESSPKTFASRLPPPKVHLTTEVGKVNGTERTEIKSPPPPSGLSRIPLPLGSKMVRQNSNLSTGSSGKDSTEMPQLPPKPATPSMSKIPPPLVQGVVNQDAPKPVNVTKIPLPKVHSGLLEPSAAPVSRIPSRLPSSTALTKHRITPDPIRAVHSPMAWNTRAQE